MVLPAKSAQKNDYCPTCAVAARSTGIERQARLKRFGAYCNRNDRLSKADAENPARVDSD